MGRRRIVAGNWKMNKTPTEAVALVEELKPLVKNDDVDVVFCVPAIDIIPVVEAAAGTNIKVGAENMYFEDKGAFTGETAPGMLVDAGVKYVIIGHSERLEYFKETNEDINKKVLKAFEYDLIPIMCVGESLDQREQGITMDFIRQQVKLGLLGVTAEQAASSTADLSILRQLQISLHRLISTEALSAALRSKPISAQLSTRNDRFSKE